MKAIFFLLVVGIVGLVITGAIQLNRSGNTITIEIDKQEVKEDIGRVIDEGREILFEAEASLHDVSRNN